VKKIIQIAVTSSSDHNYSIVYALCADGTLWSKVEDGKSDWELMEGITD